MEKQNVIYPYNGLFFSMKRNEVLVDITTQMNLESTMKRETTQTQNTTNFMVPFICNVQNRQILERRGKSVLVVSWGQQWGWWGKENDC